MKIKSVSGLTLYVKNLNKTAKFYETLGFKIRNRAVDHVTATPTGSGSILSPLARQPGPRPAKGRVRARRGPAFSST
jgi:catechol 2,3-dioxygenase-like lactoylglutathione lyase family enzyme